MGYITKGGATTDARITMALTYSMLKTMDSLSNIEFPDENNDKDVTDFIDKNLIPGGIYKVFFTGLLSMPISMFPVNEIFQHKDTGVLCTINEKGKPQSVSAPSCASMIKKRNSGFQQYKRPIVDHNLKDYL